MSKLQYTPIDELENIHRDLRIGFNSRKLKSIEYRKYQLLQLAYLVKDNETHFEDALVSDLGRPRIESGLLEIGAVLSEINNVHKNVDKWAKPEVPAFSVTWFPMRPVIRKEAKGVVLIISPFNYPVWLSLVPVAGALAAGNCVLLKPSESTPAVATLFAELFPKYLDPDLVRIVNGEIKETTKLLDLKWDHILYTGSGRVGRIVAAAAAKHITPLSLELGGKSPVFVDPKCDLEMCARRLLLGKVVNAGQTCVAPDYVLVERDFQDKLVQALRDAYDKFYPSSQPPTAPGAFSRLVSQKAFSRISNLLENTKGAIVFGGEMKEEDKYIAPTVVKDVRTDDALMSEELFGPVLPIMPVDSLDQAITFVNENDRPLCVYVFSQDPVFKAKVFDNTQSGACVANEVVIHPGAQGLPFGGIGESGSGYHTGKFGFDMFTHFRASLDSPAWLDIILGPRFPPYTDKNKRALRKLFPTLPARPGAPAMVPRSRKWFLFGIALALTGFLATWGKIPRAVGWVAK